MKDDIPTDRVPIVTYALLLANVVTYLLVGHDTALRHGLVPGDPSAGDVLTAMFLHTGLLHLLGNLLFLWWFGPAVEDSMGRVRFLAFYLVGGVVAAAAQIAVDPGSTAPLLGASGAISAVMGAYLRLYPWARILTMVFVVLFGGVVEIPVAAMLVAWFALQVALGLTDPGNVAVVAHLAGFAAGALAARLVATRVKTPESLLRSGRAAWR